MTKTLVKPTLLSNKPKQKFTPQIETIRSTLPPNLQ